MVDDIVNGDSYPVLLDLAQVLSGLASQHRFHRISDKTGAFGVAKLKENVQAVLLFLKEDCEIFLTKVTCTGWGLPAHGISNRPHLPQPTETTDLVGPLCCLVEVAVEEVAAVAAAARGCSGGGGGGTHTALMIV